MGTKHLVNMSNLIADLKESDQSCAVGGRDTIDGDQYFIILCNDEKMFREMMGVDGPTVSTPTPYSVEDVEKEGE